MLNCILNAVNYLLNSTNAVGGSDETAHGQLAWGHEAFKGPGSWRRWCALASLGTSGLVQKHTGVDFKIKTVELRGKKIRLQIWDTAGQERFNSITSAYYRSAKGIILVYDITKKETFDDLPKWMKMIDKYASEDAELLLVGNKLDCETDREISRQQGEKFAQQITGMRFCEASAKDNFNVDEIFLKLVDDILKKMPLDVLRNELSNSILSLQPEPEIPPELPPPRPHVRCC
uniref:Ras-related protein Rab-12 n=1 Tax=Oryctolagus cuniculus TaxID=9986 RepID=A0A5F9C631_RABIT